MYSTMLKVLNERENFDLTNFSWLFLSLSTLSLTRRTLLLPSRRHETKISQQKKVCRLSLLSLHDYFAFALNSIPLFDISGFRWVCFTTRKSVVSGWTRDSFYSWFSQHHNRWLKSNRINFQLIQRKWNFCVSNSIFSIFFHFSVVFINFKNILNIFYFYFSNLDKFHMFVRQTIRQHWMKSQQKVFLFDMIAHQHFPLKSRW